jgi:hypothetical protein
MPGPGSRKQSKQGFNTEHTAKKLKPQSDAEKKTLAMHDGFPGQAGIR